MPWWALLLVAVGARWSGDLSRLFEAWLADRLGWYGQLRRMALSGRRWKLGGWRVEVDAYGGRRVEVELHPADSRRRGGGIWLTKGPSS